MSLSEALQQLKEIYGPEFEKPGHPFVEAIQSVMDDIRFGRDDVAKAKLTALFGAVQATVTPQHVPDKHVLEERDGAEKKT